MFTGIVTAVEQVTSFLDGTLTIPIPTTWRIEPVSIGESISVNGCCLTVVAASEREMSFQLSQETMRRTNFVLLDQSSFVNLERALRLSDRLGGHLVQGHVDSIGKVRAIREEGEFCSFDLEVPAESTNLLVDKGSVAIDGISLTVISPKDGRFSVAVIPHTMQATNLRHLVAGNTVNIEFDIVAKMMANLAMPYLGSKGTNG